MTKKKHTVDECSSLLGIVRDAEDNLLVIKTLGPVQRLTHAEMEKLLTSISKLGEDVVEEWCKFKLAEMKKKRNV